MYSMYTPHTRVHPEETSSNARQRRVAVSCKDLKCCLPNQMAAAPLGGLQQTGVRPADHQ